MSRRYALFGAAPDTTNRGVSALFRCVLEGIGDAMPDSELLVFDNALGIREESAELSTGITYKFYRVGARGGHRYYAPENLATMSALSRFGRVIGGLHPRIRALDQCDGILDVSGGDSFSDIYGTKRFWARVRPKLIAERRGVPLVLLPQTYGPFRDSHLRRIAREAILGAQVAWARDPYSYLALKDLLGEDFDVARHKEGVDMAFGLKPRDPGSALSRNIREWLHSEGIGPLLGLNVSGLIGLDPDLARKHFHFRADYMDALVHFTTEVMDCAHTRVVLIPHVMSPPGSYGSDVEACRKVLEALPPQFHSRVAVAPTSLDECEVKWLIGQTDWFCGTRMHSTIAGMSSSVPTAAIAYSDKARGVFASCDIEQEVIDPRRLDTESVVRRLLESFERRGLTKSILLSSVPRAKARAKEQLRETVTLLEGSV